MRYLVWGYYGHQNLGDDLMLDAIIDRVSHHDPDACFIVRSHERFSRQRVEALRLESPGGSRLGRLIGTLYRIRRALRRVDVVLIGGGTLFLDKGRFNVSILHLAMLSRLARCMGIPVHVLGVGIDTLSHPASVPLLRSTLSNATTVALRDRHSMSYSAGLDSGAVLAADLLYSAELQMRLAAQSGSVGETVVCASRYLKNWYSEDLHASFTLRLLDLLRLLAGSEISDGGVVLCPFQSGIGDEDLEYCQELVERSDQIKIRIEPVRTAEDVARVFGRAQLTVSMRYHALVFSALLGRPFVGISVETKIRDICATHGMPSIDPIDLSEVGVDAALLADARSRPVDREILEREIDRSARNFAWLGHGGE